MKTTPTHLLAIYRRVLARYVAEGNPNADVQRRLIARIERMKE